MLGLRGLQAPPLLGLTEEDLIEIWIYIAQDNPGAADRVLDNIEERFYALSDNPLMGRG